MESIYKGIKFTDKDVINPDDFNPETNENYKSYNPHNVVPWLIHDHGTVICVVFASNAQDALDEAVNANKLDHLMIDPENENDRNNYMIHNKDGNDMAGQDPNCPEYTHTDGSKWWWKEGCEPAFLGNASEPFDIEELEVIKLSNPQFSFCALFNATQSK